MDNMDKKKSKIKGKNDEAWEKIFYKYYILPNIKRYGLFQISAEQIKEFREPRLMAKFDHRSDLPDIFRENSLTILPVSRGDYIIGHFDAYHRFEADSGEVMQASLPPYLFSLDYNEITSESIALNCAFSSGIIADFIEDEQLLATVSGRMSSGTFDFNIQNSISQKVHNIQVNNSQIEIDAAYEGLATLSIFEAKKELSDDFLIRQLYYPFRLWKKRISKPVKTIFLVYSNGIYRLYEYQFEDFMDYNSIKLVKMKKYSLEDTTITYADIQDVLESVSVDSVREPPLPFPQADKFERVINICELVNEQEMSRVDVTEQYNFDARQTNYYTDAARYLGLVRKTQNKGKPFYSISERGRKILQLPYKQRQMEFCRCILEHRAFRETLQLWFNTGVKPDIREIISIMKQSSLYHVSKDSTYERRSSTIRGWINWILELVNDE